MFNIVIKQINIFMLLFILIAGIGYSQTNEEFHKKDDATHFPQNKVNQAIFKYWQDKKNIQAQTNTIQSPVKYNTNKSNSYFHESFILQDREEITRTDSRSTLYIGPQPDTLLITSNYVQNGDIIIHGYGVLIVDGARLTLYGHLYQQDNGKAIFRNQAYLHVPQLFNCQYLHQLQDNASFESVNSTVDANLVYQIRQYDNSQYTALQTNFTHWNFRKLWNASQLTLEDANMVGDLTINDSCLITFTRCDTILPWFGAGADNVFDYKFPTWDVVPHYVFDNNLTGINGVNYSVTFDSCNGVMWGIESWEGSSVKIDSSFICIAFRLNKDVTIKNLDDYKYYWNLTFPFNDRTCQITRSYLHMWFPYVYDTAVVYIDSCSYAESKAYNKSEIYITNTTSDGFPSTATAVDSGFFSFSDGLCRTFASTWHSGTLLLINTIIEPRPDHEEQKNIAHDNSTFLAINCTFRQALEPFAMDRALVMFTAIDSPSVAAIEDTVDIFGSAWIDAGWQSPITFDRYKLHWSTAGDSVWTLIKESTDTVHHDILALWNTSGLSAGEYDLRLTIWDNAGDSLIAFKRITLQNSIGINNKSNTLPESIDLFQNYPNPFNPQTTIDYQLPVKAFVTLKIYDMLGKEVRTLVNENIPAGYYSIVWDGKNNSGVSVTSSVYFYQLKVKDEFLQTKKMLLLK